MDEPVRNWQEWADKYSEAAAERDRFKAALETLISVPLTWHPHGEAERLSFDATMAAYMKAREILGR